jgi:molybdopterin-dependent oxidoreductase alpha subunit
MTEPTPLQLNGGAVMRALLDPFQRLRRKFGLNYSERHLCDHKGGRIMSRKPRIEEYHEPAGGWGAAIATGAILLKQKVLLKAGAALFFMNKPGGFKCPSCAWPDPAPERADPFVFCENGAKALAWEATSKRVSPQFFAQHSVTELVRQTDYWLEEQGRITHPMVYDALSDRYVPIEWEKAFALVGKELRALSHPNEAEFYTSGRSSNEAAFLYQLFVREFGTNNFPDCSNFCHEATSQGLPPAIGVGKGTCLLEDFDLADAIFIFGQNTGTNSPRMMTELRNAARRGARIVVFNPLHERALERFQTPQNLVEMATMTSTPIATHYYQVKVGGDVAALKGMMKAAIEAEDRALRDDQPRVLDIDFIEGHTAGFDAFREDLRGTSWSKIERQSGLAQAQLEEAAEVYLEANSVMACYGMGMTQHFRGTQNVQQLVNLLLLRGNIGRPGAGIVPVRGHSNVQGDRTVGISERPTTEFLDRLQGVFSFNPPREHGHDVVHALEAVVRGHAKIFIGLGGNFVAAAPDTPVISDAFRQLKLTVNVATKLNRTHIVHGRNALILPCLARSEVDRGPHGDVQELTVEDSMSVVQASRGLLVPASPHLRSEPWIVAQMARATLGAKSAVPWEWLVEDYSRIRDKIEAVFPIFQGYNARIKVPGGFHLANAASQRIWKTPNGKANFIVFPGIEEDEHQNNPDALWLSTIRSHDQYNTTIYSTSDRYRGVFNQRDVVFLNDNEMRRRGLAPEDRVDIQTLSSDGIERVVRGLKIVRYNIPDGSCAAYYPETNSLIPLYSYDPISGTPSAKSVPVLLRRSSANTAN